MDVKTYLEFNYVRQGIVGPRTWIYPRSGTGRPEKIKRKARSVLKIAGIEVVFMEKLIELGAVPAGQGRGT